MTNEQQKRTCERSLTLTTFLVFDEKEKKSNWLLFSAELPNCPFSKRSLFKSKLFESLESNLNSIQKLAKAKLRGRIHNTSFSLKLTNGSNKLECYIMLVSKGLTGINTLAY
jgi:hypothetical protein